MLDTTVIWIVVIVAGILMFIMAYRMGRAIRQNLERAKKERRSQLSKFRITRF